MNTRCTREFGESSTTKWVNISRRAISNRICVCYRGTSDVIRVVGIGNDDKKTSHARVLRRARTARMYNKL